MWNRFLADTVGRYNGELRALQGQLDQYRQVASSDLDKKKKLDFLNTSAPVIKKKIFHIFLRLIFPSQLEVTSTTDRSLAGFGLTANSPLAQLCFQDILFNMKGTAKDPVNLSDDASVASSSASTPTPIARHPYDNPETRRQLWFEFGLGRMCVKAMNVARNTHTNVLRECVRKCCVCFLQFSCVYFGSTFTHFYSLFVLSCLF